MKVEFRALLLFQGKAHEVSLKYSVYLSVFNNCLGNLK